MRCAQQHRDRPLGVRLCRGKHRRRGRRGGAGGGGQPIHDSVEMAASRGDVLWNIDKNTKVRFSHENKDVQALYKEYLRQPLGHKAHMLLHTDHFGWKMPSGH